MPYFVHPKGSDHEENCCTFSDRAKAHAYATELTLRDNVAWMVSFRVSVEETNDWHEREQSRFDEGLYLTVPWFHDVIISRKFDSAVGYHFVHLSTVHPGMVAYTPSDEHGVQDRQVRCKPGKYLAEFYETLGHMTHAEVQSYVTQCQIVLDSQSLSIATTADDIVRIYRGNEPAPQSCMTFKVGLRDRDGTIRHPCEVYGDSDLAVAYYGPIDAVEARAIVWPAKYRYSRVYGTRSGGHVGTNGERLKRLLSEAGYSSGDISGAKIRHIDYRGSYLMPYIDNIYYADDLGNGFLRLGEGDISTSETCGYTSGQRESDTIECEDCGREYEDGDDCEYCNEHRWACEHCDSTQFGGSRAVGGEHWCDSCYNEVLQTCADDDCSHTWIECDIFTDEQTEMRAANETIDLCQSCASRYTWCESCEVSYDSQVCPDCERSPRCEHTADLLMVATRQCRLEVWDSEAHRGVWAPCFWNSREPNIGTMNDMIAVREIALARYPEVQYRIVPFEVTANVASL
jgi:hypothetical protein